MYYQQRCGRFRFVRPDFMPYTAATISFGNYLGACRATP